MMSRAFLLLACAIAAGCGAVLPSPVVRPSPGTSPSVASSAVSRSWAGTLHFAVAGDSGPLGPLSNANSPVGDDFEKAGFIDPLIYAALFRDDAQLRPQPDLASSCEIGTDAVTIICHLAKANFQDGSPVTADDVVFTYEVQSADTTTSSPFGRSCISNLGVGTSGCLSDVLASVSKVDDRSVAFHLRKPYGPFLTLVLPWLWIDSKAVVMRDYAAFHAKAVTFAPAVLATEAATLAGLAQRPGANCDPLLMDGVQLAARAGVLVPDRAEYDYLPGGVFDACGYAATLSLDLDEAAASLRASGVRAIALAYPGLAFNRHPVGAGPYRLASYAPGRTAVLQADPGYHNGSPVTGSFEFDIYPDSASAALAVATARADLFVSFDAGAVQPVLRAPGIRVGREANPEYHDLIYNVRPGHLFADPAIRTALELCVDKPAAVAAATDDLGIPAYTDIPPGTWATDLNVPTPGRDLAKAKALIEDSGWRLGPDGIYAKAGRRLAASVYVRNDASDRVKFVELLSLQARDCGMDIRIAQGDFRGNLQSIAKWPNVPPGSRQPFDLYFATWLNGYDPVPIEFLTSQITTTDRTIGANFGGFSDPRVDALAGRIVDTYDLATRAALYSQYEQVIAADQPAYFGWTSVHVVLATAGLTTTGGSLDLSAANALWQFESIGVPASDTRPTPGPSGP